MIRQINKMLKEKSKLSFIFEVDELNATKISDLIYANKGEMFKIINIEKHKKVEIIFKYKPKN